MSPPPPPGCESSVEHNLKLRCFSRDAAVLAEEFNGQDGLERARAALQQPFRDENDNSNPSSHSTSTTTTATTTPFSSASSAAVAAAAAVTPPFELEDRERWRVVPSGSRSSDAYSPLFLANQAVMEFGPPACLARARAAVRRAAEGAPTTTTTAATAAASTTAEGVATASTMDAPSAAAVGRDVGSGCVPLYRPRYAYVHRVVSRAWLASGAVCTGLVGDGRHSGDFLLRTGVANASLASAAVGKASFAFPPCLRVPTLAKAWRRARAFIAQLEPAERGEWLGAI